MPLRGSAGRSESLHTAIWAACAQIPDRTPPRTGDGSHAAQFGLLVRLQRHQTGPAWTAAPPPTVVAPSVTRSSPPGRSAIRQNCRSRPGTTSCSPRCGEHQVLIVAGETGSGKSTQLPKLCIEAGRGVAGLIGHTQPRRIAARTIAERLASELDSLRRRGGRVLRAIRRPRRRRHDRACDDRRHPSRRDPTRPDVAPLRHADRRRGPRAQPQHRLHPRLPAPAAAPAARPVRRRDVGDDRHCPLRPPLRRRRCRRAR